MSIAVRRISRDLQSSGRSCPRVPLSCSLRLGSSVLVRFTSFGHALDPTTPRQRPPPATTLFAFRETVDKLTMSNQPSASASLVVRVLTSGGPMPKFWDMPAGLRVVLLPALLLCEVRDGFGQG